jgi:NAD(P)-dependent dehydrogenase (short-subunit alcohol dehydrogenase family)
MDLGLEGRVAIVTGGSRGIGRACAASLLAEGAKVALVSRDADRLEASRNALAEVSGGTVIAVPTELRSNDAVWAMVERTKAELGRIDILINAAATVTPTAFMDLTEERWLDVFEQKLNGYARCLRHVIPVLRGQKSARSSTSPASPRASRMRRPSRSGSTTRPRSTSPSHSPTSSPRTASGSTP